MCDRAITAGDVIGTPPPSCKRIDIERSRSWRKTERRRTTTSEFKCACTALWAMASVLASIRTARTVRDLARQLRNLHAISRDIARSLAQTQVRGSRDLARSLPPPPDLAQSESAEFRNRSAEIVSLPQNPPGGFSSRLSAPGAPTFSKQRGTSCLLRYSYDSKKRKRTHPFSKL